MENYTQNGEFSVTENIDNLTSEVNVVNDLSSNLESPENIVSEVNSNDSMDSMLSNAEQINSELDLPTIEKYVGGETDNIVVSVDNSTHTITATVKQIKYKTAKDFPIPGSSKLLYVAEDEKAIYYWDTNLLMYVKASGGASEEDSGYDDTEIRGEIKNLKDNKADKTDLDNYYTKSQTYTKQEIDTAISNVEVDLSGYYTKTETDAITTQTLGSAKSYTDTKVADLINSAPETLDTIGEVAKAIQDNATVIDALNSAIGNKVDKIEGKGLSTNDYTTAEKTKLAGLSNYDDTSIKSSITTLETNKANKSEIPDISGKADKTEIPTNYVTTDTLQEVTGLKIFNDVQIKGVLQDDAGTKFNSLYQIQPRLIAGRGISIDGNTISSTAEDVSVKDQYGVALRPYTGGGANTTDNKDALSERAIATALPYINGRHDYTQSNEIYAPTTSGTTGQILVANSSSQSFGGWEEKTSGGTPSWKSPSELGLVTETELNSKDYATQTSLNSTNSTVSSLSSTVSSHTSSISNLQTNKADKSAIPTTDSSFSTTSTNPVQNKVITQKFNEYGSMVEILSVFPPSVGNKTLRYGLTNYRYLLLCIQEDNRGWRTEFVSIDFFKTLNSTQSRYTIMFNNDAKNKFVNLYYVNDTTIMIDETYNLSGFKIYGIG